MKRLIYKRKRGDVHTVFKTTRNFSEHLERQTKTESTLFALLPLYFSVDLFVIN